MELQTHNGYTFQIDDEDYEKIKDYHWYGCKRFSKRMNGDPGKARYYIMANLHHNHRHTVIRLHRLITNAPKNIDIDHKDGNGLDNRKCNLRLCTRFQNIANRGIQANNTSGYKGVKWHKCNKRWQAYIRQKTLGSYDSREDAARAYNRAALLEFGEFAYLNSVSLIRNDDTLDRV